MDNLTCIECNKKLGFNFMQTPEVKLDGKSYCQKCADKLIMKQKEIQQKREARTRGVGIDGVLLSTTDTLQGYKIVEYIDVVFNRAIFEWFTLKENGDITAVKSVERMIKTQAYELGGNAVVGIHLAYYSANEKEISIGGRTQLVTIHGTVVKVEPIEESIL